MSNEFEPKKDSYYSYDKYNSIRSSNEEKFSLTTPSRLPLKLLSSQIIKPKSQNPKVSFQLFKLNENHMRINNSPSAEWGARYQSTFFFTHLIVLVVYLIMN